MESHCPGNHSIYSMTITKDNQRIIVGDCQGYVFIYDISTAALTEGKNNTLPLKFSFQCHANVITDMVLFDRFLITSSADCSVRIFTIEGQYVGSFGQMTSWDLHNPLSFSKFPADIHAPDILPVKKKSVPLVKAKQEESIYASDYESKGANAVVESWFLKSIYAKERILSRPRRQRGSHLLTDILASTKIFS